MRSVAYLLLFYSLYNFGRAIYEQNQGVATLRTMRGLREEVVAEQEDRERYRNLLSYRISRGAVFLVGGLIVLGIARRSEESDPLSPDFGAKMKDEPVDPALEEELRKRRGGLR
jgi:hypothetical protein